MRLLPILAVALAAGLAVRHPLPASLLLLPVLLAPRLRGLRAPALAFVVGTLLSLAPPPSGLVRVFPDGADLIRVEGEVVVPPDLPVAGRTDLTLDVDRVAGRPLAGRILVLLPEGSPLPMPGARVTATGRLVRPRPAGNPGERGPRAALAARGVTHLLALRSAPSLRIVESPSPFSPAVLVHRARTALDRAILRLRPARTGGILSCLILGRRDRLPDDLADAFRRSGTSHFLAISGLHVGLLCGLLWLLLRPLPVRPGLAAALVATAALFYAAVTGFRPPALRAALFVVLLAGGTILRRRSRILNLLALAAIAVLSLDPTALGRAGFQLSFAAILAIVLLVPPLTDGLFARAKLLEKFTVPRAGPRRLLRRYLMRAVPVSLAAWLGTAPVALVRFGTVSTLVVPANLVVFPLVALLVPFGFLAALTGFSAPATAVADALAAVVRVFSAVPGAAVTVPAPPLPAVVAFYALLLLASRRPALGRRAVGLLLAALAALAASAALRRDVPDEPRVTVLAVGHGLAVVVETPENGVLVYDAGSGRPGIFHRVILPWLRERGISRIDLLVLSHDDLDHTSGVDALRRALPVGRFVEPGDVRRGDRLPLPGAAVEVLGPPPGLPITGNDTSTILRVRSEGLTLLLVGDIEEEGIARLVASGVDLSADVLVLPHHGRPSPAAAGLATAVGAKVLVASDGPGDPIDPVWSGALRTSERGAVTVLPGQVRTWR